MSSPPAKTQDPRAARSRQAMMAAAIELLLHNPDASLSEVAARAGVGRATLYRQFKTREELVQAIAIESLACTEEALRPAYEQDLQGRAAIEFMFRAVMGIADRFHFLLSLWAIADKNPQVTRIYDAQLQALYTWVEQGKRNGEISDQLSNDWIVTSIDALVYSGWWLLREGATPAEEIAEYAIRTLFRGIADT